MICWILPVITSDLSHLGRPVVQSSCRDTSFVSQIAGVSLVTFQEGQGIHHAGGGPEWPMPPIRFGGATSGSPGGLAGHQIQSLRVPWSKWSKSSSKSLEIPLDICGLSMFGDKHHVKIC